MVNEIDSLKCSIKIDYDIPFDYTEERELAFESIVNSLYDAFKYYRGVKILANYTTNTNIDIYRYTDSTISKENFKSNIKLALALISKYGVKVVIENKEYSHSVVFYVEFSNSDNFKIIKDEDTYKNSTNNDKKGENINIKDSDKKNDNKDDTNGLVNVEVKFNAVIDKSFVETFKRMVNNKMDTFIDPDSFPEVKCIFGVTTKVLGNEGLVYPPNN